MDAAMKSGTWKKIPGHALRERTLGIIGVGEIGKAVVRRAHAFGMRVLGNDVTEVSPSFIQETGVTMVGLEAIYHQADYISINCDLNESSRKLVDASSFSSMEMLPVLINTARGSIVDETALIGALLPDRFQVLPWTYLRGNLYLWIAPCETWTTSCLPPTTRTAVQLHGIVCTAAQLTSYLRRSVGRE